jgi:16S rRNA (cytosine1402-N4)-methyltransferase
MRRHASPDPVYAGLPDMPAHARAKLRLVGKSVEPTGEETERNPRARSARLRVAERLSEGIAA